jgi:hypothetical protein
MPHAYASADQQPVIFTMAFGAECFTGKHLPAPQFNHVRPAGTGQQLRATTRRAGRVGGGYRQCDPYACRLAD